MLTDVAARNIVSVLLNDVLDRPQANAINLSAEHRFCFTIESDRILGNFKRFELCNRLWCCRTKVDLSLLFQDGNEFCPVSHAREFIRANRPPDLPTSFQEL